MGRPPIVSPMQAATLLPDSDIQRSDNVGSTDAYGMPDDLALPISSRNGVFVPATGKPSDILDYDPWTWAIPARILDDSRPVMGPYGEVSGPGLSGSIVAEWGGMPAPVRDYQDVTASVAYSPRQVNYHMGVGPAGRFDGPSQTAYEAGAQTPQPDYWSTIILKG